MAEAPLLEVAGIETSYGVSRVLFGISLTVAAGEMVSLESVERIAATAAPGYLHAASTRADTSKGEAIVLFTTAPALARDQLSASARSLGLSDLAVPRHVITVAEIPLLGTGKTDYVRLKGMAEAAAAVAPAVAEKIA